MNHLDGKIAVVTGASSGIGLAIVKDLIKSGVIVIGIARRIKKMDEFKSELIHFHDKFYPYECDISSLDSIKSIFKKIEEQFHKINILINNAGLLKYTGILLNDNESDLKQLMDVNLMGAIYCCKEVYNIMKDLNEECHIINVNSVLGHCIPFNLAALTYNLYPSSKYGLRAATEVLRQELIENKKFRISSISPGLVKTDISHSAGHPYADHIMGSKSILQVEDISRAIIFILESPQHVLISEMIVTPVGQKF